MKRLMENTVFVGVGDRLVLSGLTHDAVAVCTEANNRRGGAVALGVHDNGRRTALEDGHGGVSSTKVDTKNLTH